MKTRITLTIDPDVARRARRVAVARRTSVSGLVEEYLRDTPLGPESTTASFCQKWAGRFRLREAAPGTDPRRDALLEKYGGSTS